MSQIQFPMLFRTSAKHATSSKAVQDIIQCNGAYDYLESAGEGGYITINRFLKAKAMATNTRFFYFWYLTGSRTQNDLNVFTHAREC